ncbi:alpha/beta hydrolase [Umezawaea endophytica]|uniref:Alpha/beta hydrolase n=1 Tax=Umezawaea endophytica TaxID=1654476 RepID=A0A9X2VWI7_9PSEU|nr:alpha/beta hydrolase [Umezawaea endophytica]MCS7483980.1 alpha/beta hydrolase [Umezawaea endophytica]
MTTTESDSTRVGPPPPFDPELAAALEAMPDLPTSLTADLIPALRQGTVLRDATDEELRRGGAFEVSERPVPGPHGDIPVLILKPTAATGLVGAIYYVHGGGMIMGTNRGADSTKAFDLAQELGLAVVSVDYRLAPEHPHPVPVEECYAGLVWTVEHAEELGIDPERIVIAGASAGGGLAAATTLLARDRGAPALAAQLLFCPMLDDRNESPSSRQMVGLGVWDRTANDTGWTALLGDERGGPDVSPYAAPARESDLSGLPPTYLDVGSAETFRDEVVAYASAIWAAGGNAELHVWPGGFHGFELLAPESELSRAASGPRIPWLRRVLGI